jgi:hypothetical protein
MLVKLLAKPPPEHTATCQKPNKTRPSEAEFNSLPGHQWSNARPTCRPQLYDFPSNTVLGAAGPRYKRADALQTPITGFMQFNSKLLNVVNETQWRAVVLHEMGHVLGIGVPDYWVSLHGCVPRSQGTCLGSAFGW